MDGGVSSPALVLAAGLSRRMGRFKLTLPWGATTVIGQVLATLAAAAVAEIVVVTGHRDAEVADAVRAAGIAARCVHNPRYASGEMLSSIQAGLAALEPAEGRPAALLCLGDQPQMQVATVRAVLAAGAAANWQRVIIPSHNMRAGHPVLLPRSLWPAILAADDNLRRVLADHRAMVEYLTVNSPSILADLDTPEDYERGRHAHEPPVQPDAA
ncbi:MAG: Molybdenum cofactor cytidylyltransferase [Chloroflexi bacterium ADurb.Bin325]|nr:MAG: Molybdenum cofactor cytidylyltransferase [Chloroflexi bacterium ADurb.Bin325]